MFWHHHFLDISSMWKSKLLPGWKSRPWVLVYEHSMGKAFAIYVIWKKSHNSWYWSHHCYNDVAWKGFSFYYFQWWVNIMNFPRVLYFDINYICFILQAEIILWKMGMHTHFPNFSVEGGMPLPRHCILPALYILLGQQQLDMHPDLAILSSKRAERAQCPMSFWGFAGYSVAVWAQQQHRCQG